MSHLLKHHAKLLFVYVAYLPQFKLLEYCTSKGIHLSAYSPLGSSGSPLLQDETVAKIANKHNKSVAQILISWGATRGSVLPKSVSPEVSFIQMIEKKKREKLIDAS